MGMKYTADGGIHSIRSIETIVICWVYSVLAKAIHSFARIGHDLFLEVDAMKGLALRTVNLTKSSFAMILFNLDFFTSFTVKSNPSDPYENQCKLSMKSCLGVFRNMKQVSVVLGIEYNQWTTYSQFGLSISNRWRRAW